MSEKRDRTIPPGIFDEARRSIHNKKTGETVTFNKYGYETNGEHAEATIACAPGGGPPPHYHTTYNENFEPIDGELIVYLGDAQVKHVLQPGEAAFVPMGTQHRFTNESDKWVHAKGQVLPASPGFERALYILFGLAGDDLVGDDGMPKSLIHTAIISQMSDMKFAGIPGTVMNTLVAVLAQYGKWSGEEERLLQKYWD